MSAEKNVIQVNSLPARSPSWHSKLNGSGEKIKNWAAILMGVAALITAIGTYYKPTSLDDKINYEKKYNNLHKELNDLSIELHKLSDDVKYLYRLQKEKSNKISK